MNDSKYFFGGVNSVVQVNEHGISTAAVATMTPEHARDFAFCLWLAANAFEVAAEATERASNVIAADSGTT